MTLKELLTQVGFDELLPYLEKHEPEHLDNLYDFREAYDILRNLEPAKDFEGKIYVEWHGGEWEGEEKWIGVGPMHDCTWEEDLAKEIVVADDIHLTKTEIAMHFQVEQRVPLVVYIVGDIQSAHASQVSV